jgi:glycosyltransferase involved in cell wall biosynthesis
LKKQTVLIIGYVWVAPNSSAAGSRMLQIIEQFLIQNWQITFASPAQKGEKAMDLTSINVAEMSIELNAKSFDDFIIKMQPSIVLFDRFMMEEQFGWRVIENCPNALRVLDTEDLHCLRKSREAALKNNKEFSLDDLLNSDIAKREMAAILRCDLSLIISTFEMDLLRKVFKINEKLYCHLPFLLNPIDTVQRDQWKSFEERNHFAMIGNFLHTPNVDAVLLLKKTIWKLIKKVLPKAELHIYGAYPTQQILQLHNKKEGFLIKGYTANPNQVMEDVKVVLAPLRFGAGIKGKLTEAMLCGTPSITTEIGAEGMHKNLPWNGFITDDFEEFSQRAIELYTNKVAWDTAQKNGTEIINQIYDRETVGVLFIDRIQEIQQNIKAHRTQNFLGGMLQHQSLQSTKYMSKWIEEKNKA